MIPSINNFYPLSSTFRLLGHINKPVESSLRLKNLDLTFPSMGHYKKLSIGRQFSSSSNERISFKKFLKKEGYIGIPKDLEITLIPMFAYYGVPAYIPLLETIKDRNLVKEKGIMLGGSPGTGKTFFARILAKFLRSQISGSVRIEELSAGKLLTSGVGDTEERIRDLFEKAQQNRKDLHVISIDEFDSIGRSRSWADRRWEVSHVNEFLSCMDGLKELTNTLVIAMTNNLNEMDSAFLRPGRFGTIVQIPLPSKESRKDLFELYSSHLKKKNLIEHEVDYEHLADISTGLSGADIRGIVDTVNRIAFSRLYHQFEENKISLDSIKNHHLGIILMKDFVEKIRSVISQKNQKSISVKNN